jgi:hypothetical protein
MDPETAKLMFNPAIQYGFAGFAAILLGLLFWLIRRLLDLFERVTAVMGEHSSLIKVLDSHLLETRETMFSMRDKFLTLKCVRDDK